ncbi:MAG: flagellar hook-associated protein 3 [Dehalococcoidia bacterium]|nr:flagellar hook-associated protein 3 [Dehalococcoidia bacterium]
MMRVTHRMVVGSVITGLQRNVGKLEDLQQKIGSGKRVQRPADDPVATALAMRLRAQRDTNDQYLRNIASARSWLQISESTLNDLTGSLQRARELGLQGGTDSASTGDRQAIANEIDQLLRFTAQLANSSVDVDQHVFGGFQTLGAVDPFVESNNTFVYQGDAGVVERQIGPDSRIQINTPGSTVFTPAIDALAALRDELNSSTATGQSIVGKIDALDTAIDTTLATRTVLGSRMNRLEDAENRLTGLQITVEKALSDQEDLDFADALTNLALQDAAYKASLQSGARAILPSLLDWLR